MTVPAATLKKLRVFSGISDEDLDVVAKVAKQRDIPSGMSLFLNGSAADAMFGIESGTMEIVTGTGDQTEVLCVLGPGSHFGELGMLRPSRRMVSARARTQAKLIEIRRADFSQVIRQVPQVAVQVIMAVVAVLEQRIKTAVPILA